MKKKKLLIAFILIIGNCIFPIFSFAQGIAGGGQHSLSLCNDNTVRSWGGNWVGQLGNGTINSTGCKCITTPVQVNFVTGITAISGGGFHSLALKNDSTVWAWGDNFYGELGEGDTLDKYTPVQVGGITDITAISAGWYHSLALKNDSTVWAWGTNWDGQLGDSTNVGRYTPVQVRGFGNVGYLTGITAIATEGWHSLALKKDSTIWAWGWNHYGQLGNNTGIDSTPVKVGFLNKITAIAVGNAHSLALKNDSTVWAWGFNGAGELGDGNTIDRMAPVQVRGPGNVGFLKGIIAIAGGGNHSLALKNDGTVWTWGYNIYGQLGDGTTINRTTPVQVNGLTNVVAISGGGWHSLALKNDGSVWTWGYNQDGELGNDTSGNNNYIPVQVNGLCYVNGIDELQQGSISIYPNPSSGLFTMQINSQWLMSNSQIDIYNVLGEKVWHSEIYNQQSQIDLSSQSKGIYFIKVQSGNNVYTKKVIISN